MSKVISLKIDLTKIDKKRIYVSEKTGAKYLDAIIMLNDEPDRFENNGMVVQSVSKEEREAGTRGEILGNVKILSNRSENPNSSGSANNARTDTLDDTEDQSLPF
jgi:hypothetical protein